MFKEYPKAKVFIAGESAAEEGINPALIHPDAINLAHPFGDAYGLLKVLKLNLKGELNRSNLIILNTSFLSYSTFPLNHDYFILNKADTILDMNFFELYHIWKYQFPEKLLLIAKCRIINCEYNSHNFRLDSVFLFNLVKNKGWLISPSPIKESLVVTPEEIEDIRQFLEKSEIMLTYFYKAIKLFARSNARIVIVIPPVSTNYKHAIQKYSNLIQLNTPVKDICNKFSNCAYLDYYNWDNQNLGKEKENYYFANVNHLNKKGVDKFSKILRKDLEAIPMLKGYF